jgi:spermidine synthase
MSVHSIEVSEADGVRFLHFGSEWIQGAMRVRRPYDLELEYTRAMMACLLFRPAPKNILVIGMGAGSLVKFALRQLPDARITVVEIDSRVIAVAREQFRVPGKDDRLIVAVADGFDYTRDSRSRFDLVLVDGFDADARPGALDSVAFYTAVRERLAQGGVMSVNLFGKRRGFRAAKERIEAAFAGRVRILPPCAGGNIIALAGRGKPLALAEAELSRRAWHLRTHCGLDLSCVGW